MTTAKTAADDPAQLVEHAVRELARRTRFPVAFGGLLDGGEVTVTSIVGSRTRSLEGLRVRLQRGLGGKAMTELRPRMTTDYRSSRQITHDYDGYVLGEGLGALLAIPIVVDGRSRGVLYAGAWAEQSLGDVATAPAVEIARDIATELHIRDEVTRRLEEMIPPTIPAPRREELRESFAELRSIAGIVTDDALRERLAAVERSLVALVRDEEPETTVAGGIRLSPRETDVLACVALGATNAEIAPQLGLREGTVKAYLSSAMAKLDVSTRHAAVARARRAGILP